MNIIKSIIAGAMMASVSMVTSIQQASAEDVTINLGYAAAETSTYGVLAAKFEELAEEYSGGSIDVKVRCCAQLLTEDEAFKALQLGTVDMFIITGNNVSPHFPLMDAFVLPYIFQSEDHAYKVLGGEIGTKFASDLQAATGVHLLTYGFVGNRDFFNSVRPIKSMADMSGIKVRVPKNQVMIDTFEEFGAAPILLPWADTPTALQTGTVDGGEYHKKEMASQTDDIRKFLTTEGGMAPSEVDLKDFIAAGLRVQDKYAAENDEAFKKLLSDVRKAAE